MVAVKEKTYVDVHGWDDATVTVAVRFEEVELSVKQAKQLKRELSEAIKVAKGDK